MAARFFTSCEWSHCGMIFDDRPNMVYESRLIGGVKTNRLESVKNRGHWAIITVKIHDEREAMNFASRQVGKNYDYLGALGNSRKTGNRWHCTSYVTHAVNAGGVRLVRELYDVQPRDLWMLPFDIEDENMPAGKKKDPDDEE